MINLPEKLTKYINQDSRTFKARIVTPLIAFEQEIMGFQLTSNFVADNISFGYACSAMLEIQLCNVGNWRFQGSEFELFVGSSIDRRMEYVSMGAFRVQKAQRVGNMTMIIAYDRMFDTGRVPYSTELTFPASAKALIRELCTKCKIAFKDTLDEDAIIQSNSFGERTCREVLGYLAGHYGMNAVINRQGEVEFKWFTNTDFVTNESRISEPTVREYDYELGYIKCNTGKETLECGDGKNGFTFDCPTMTQERLNYLFKQRAWFRYNVADFELLLGDLRLEVGDIIRVNYNDQILKVPIMAIYSDFDGGFQNRIVSYGQSDAEQAGISISKRFTEIKDDFAVLNDITKATIALNDMITNSLGLYRTSATLADGSTKTYLHDKPKLEDSFTIYTLVEGGFAFTTQGWNDGNPVWQYGVSKDGNAVLNALVANTLTALHITGSEIDGTTFRGGRIEAKEGSSYFDLNNGKLYCDNAELSGKFEVNPTSNTSLKLRQGTEAVQFINRCWGMDGVGYGSNLDLDPESAASLDFVQNGEVAGTVCFATSRKPEHSVLGPLLMLGTTSLIVDFVLGGTGTSVTSLTAPNANGEITTYIDGAEKSRYTESGMSILGETNTDDVTFNSVEEIKTNISEAKNGAVDIIKKAKVYNYDLKRDKAPKKRTKTKGNRYGFVIGREVPDELLAEGKESISLYNTVALLTKAVQEQAEEIELLKGNQKKSPSL